MSFKVVLGLGSNLPDRLRYLKRALNLLGWGGTSLFPIQIIKISSVYESAAMLPDLEKSNSVKSPDQAWNLPYYNLAVLCRTSLSPQDLLIEIKKTEDLVGRVQRTRWAPREIDIDILAYDRRFVFKSPTLNIPHPGLNSRPFALLPFTDIAPDWEIVGPEGTFQTVQQLSKAWRFAEDSCIPFQTRKLLLPLTEVVGILNITPDSFSGEGVFDCGNQAEIESRVQALIHDCAAVIDIGAESTRPQAIPLTPEQEWDRLKMPLKWITEMRDQNFKSIKLSLDTRHYQVAEKGLELGVNWINDVSGLQNTEMQKVLIAHRSKDISVVFMHSLSVPVKIGETLPENSDVLALLKDWACNKIRNLVELGIPKERLIFDPGIGFGKSLKQNWEILKNIHQFHTLGIPILVGHSRKSFLSKLNVNSPQQRDFETAILSGVLAGWGVQYLRVHRVAETQRALKTFLAIHEEGSNLLAPASMPILK